MKLRTLCDMNLFLYTGGKSICCVETRQATRVFSLYWKAHMKEADRKWVEGGVKMQQKGPEPESNPGHCSSRVWTLTILLYEVTPNSLWLIILSQGPLTSFFQGFKLHIMTFINKWSLSVHELGSVFITWHKCENSIM